MDSHTSLRYQSPPYHNTATGTGTFGAAGTAASGLPAAVASYESNALYKHAQVQTNKQTDKHAQVQTRPGTNRQTNRQTRTGTNIQTRTGTNRQTNR